MKYPTENCNWQKNSYNSTNTAINCANSSNMHNAPKKNLERKNFISLVIAFNHLFYCDFILAWNCLSNVCEMFKFY